MFAHAVLPLAAALMGSGLLATAAAIKLKADTQYAETRAEVRQTLQLDWQPASLAARSEGQIKCWQRTDAAVRDAALLTDYQGNVYLQDQRSSVLKVLELKPGFKLTDKHADWMSSNVADEARRASSVW